MEQVSKQQPVNKTAFRVLVALSVTHCLNDSLQSVISAVYPLFKDDLALSFAQICLFVFLIATAMGTLAGGPIGDKIGRKYVIWGSILGAASFSLLMPHVGFAWTIVLSFCVGLVLSSAFPAILLYA